MSVLDLKLKLRKKIKKSKKVLKMEVKGKKEGVIKNYKTTCPNFVSF